MDTQEGANAIAWDSCGVGHACSLSLQEGTQVCSESNREVKHSRLRSRDRTAIRSLLEKPPRSIRTSPRLMRRDQEFLAGGAPVVSLEVWNLQGLLQRDDVRVVARERGLQFRDNAVAQPGRFFRPEPLQEREQ